MAPPIIAPADLPKRGDIIAGKYQVEDVLGAGGMGIVVAARHLALRQRVAVKFLLPAAMKSPEAGARFLREAQSAVAIQSEHVARVLDVGTLESGAPYMVMEHLSGTDLGHVLESRGLLPIGEAIDLVLQACEAIAEAHARGILHRDLKPANLFITTRADGSSMVKVLDFGLSTAASVTDSAPEASLTATDSVIGSPPYMSPEQLRSLKRVDARTDIWSLGVILYLLLTRRHPFDGDSLIALCMSIYTDSPRPLRAIRPEVPGPLDALILRCLEKDVSRRVQNVAELARGLAPFGSPGSALSVERIVKVMSLARASSPGAATELSGSAGEPTFDAATARLTAWGTTTALARRRTSAIVVVGAFLAVAGVIAIGSVFWVRSPKPKGVEAAAEAAPPAMSSPLLATAQVSAAIPSTTVSEAAGAPASTAMATDAGAALAAVSSAKSTPRGTSSGGLPMASSKLVPTGAPPPRPPADPMDKWK